MHEEPLVDLDLLVSKVERLREAEPYMQVRVESIHVVHRSLPN